jgi:hypothetical protein
LLELEGSTEDLGQLNFIVFIELASLFELEGITWDFGQFDFIGDIRVG